MRGLHSSAAILETNFKRSICNLYSITTNQAAIAALFRVVVLTEGEVGMPKLAIVATIEVAPERRDQLLPLLMAHRTRCLKDEPGTLQFEVLVSREDDTKVLLYEVYRDDAAFDVHLNGPHIERVREEAAGMILNLYGTRCLLVEWLCQTAITARAAAA